jgi:hypothetical protein
MRLDWQRLAVTQQPMTGEVDLDPLEVDDGRRRLERDCLLGAPKEGSDPGGQLAQAERLRDVVVGAQLEPDDLVELGVLCRQHHDRHARFRADDPADLDARQLGQHEVEQDEIRALGPELCQCLAAVSSRDNPESLRLERVDERLAQGRLVVHDEDRSCHSRPAYRAVLTACCGGPRQLVASGRFMKSSVNSVQRPSPSKRKRNTLS